MFIITKFYLLLKKSQNYCFNVICRQVAALNEKNNMNGEQQQKKKKRNVQCLVKSTNISPYMEEVWWGFLHQMLLVEEVRVHPVMGKVKDTRLKCAQNVALLTKFIFSVKE